MCITTILGAGDYVTGSTSGHCLFPGTKIYLEEDRKSVNFIKPMEMKSSSTVKSCMRAQLVPKVLS